jgi:hypothetical protein
LNSDFLFLITQNADQFDGNSISYEAFCKAWEEDDDQFDWNDISANLMEELEEEMSAL